MQQAKLSRKLFAIACALLLWQGAAALLDQPLLLASPYRVGLRLISLVQTRDFWLRILESTGRISLGLFLGIGLGVLFAAIAARSSFLQTMLEPYFLVLKSIPVASFIILALMWLKARQLSTLISMMVVLPLVYFNALQGFLAPEKHLLEMAKVFHFSCGDTLRLIRLPALLPFLRSALQSAVGMAWKSGVAAEVIGLPDGTIGEKLYDAKIYLSAADLFAWTAVLIVLSAVFERLFLYIADHLMKGREKGVNNE
jgi:NitT/TauT family transport system permease protein